MPRFGRAAPSHGRAQARRGPCGRLGMLRHNRGHPRRHPQLQVRQARAHAVRQRRAVRTALGAVDDRRSHRRGRAHQDGRRKRSRVRARRQSRGTNRAECVPGNGRRGARHAEPAANRQVGVSLDTTRHLDGTSDKCTRRDSCRHFLHRHAPGRFSAAESVSPPREAPHGRRGTLGRPRHPGKRDLRASRPCEAFAPTAVPRRSRPAPHRVHRAACATHRNASRPGRRCR